MLHPKKVGTLPVDGSDKEKQKNDLLRHLLEDFGKDILKDIGKTAKEFGARALLVYGQNSIKKKL